MAFKSYESKGPDSWLTLGGHTKMGEKNPDKIEGYYLGRLERPSKFNPGKTDVTFMFRTVKGVVGVKGNANLINVMTRQEQNFTNEEGRSPLNANTIIEFTGMHKLSNGNTMKTFSVQFDADDVVDAPITSTEDDEIEQVEEEDEFDQDAIALAAAERKAKVAALLKGGGAKGKVAKN